MLSKLKADSEATLYQRKQTLIYLLGQIPQNIITLRSYLYSSYTSCYCTLLSFPEQSLILILSLIEKHYIYSYLDGAYTSYLHTFLRKLLPTLPVPLFTFFLNLYYRYSYPYKQMLLLDCIAYFILPQIYWSIYPKILAIFIRISGNVIRNYLMVKHEPTKFEKDRMENDITIVTNSQKWVGKAYLMFLDNLKKSGSEWKTRLAILVGLCEMLGAILYAMRENQLDNELLASIIYSLLQFCFKYYSIQYISNAFIFKLKQNNFNNPITKLYIPDCYDHHRKLNTQAYAYLIHRYLQIFDKSIYTDGKLLEYLSPAFGYILVLPYKFKSELMLKMKYLLLGGNCLLEKIESVYPIALLLFRVHKYAKEEYEFFCEKLLKNYVLGVTVNRMMLLQKIDLAYANAYKNVFIVKCLFDYNCTKAVEICLFMRNMQLSFASEAYTELVIRLIQQVVVDCPEKGKKAIIEMIKKQKSFNSELCAEIYKVISV